MNSKYNYVNHTFGPIYNEESQILILGSFPSVKSREQNFYYGHPQNRFWKVLAGIKGERIPTTLEEKQAFLLKNHIAIWDVISSCHIIGSSDSSIKNVVPNDINLILDHASISKIIINGGKAYQLFQTYCFENIKGACPLLLKLPSTSPANAAFSLERLLEIWGKAIN